MGCLRSDGMFVSSWDVCVVCTRDLKNSPFREVAFAVGWLCSHVMFVWPLYTIHKHPTSTQACHDYTSIPRVHNQATANAISRKGEFIKSLLYTLHKHRMTTQAFPRVHKHPMTTQSANRECNLPKRRVYTISFVHTTQASNEYTSIPRLHKHPMTTQSANSECNPPEIRVYKIPLVHTTQASHDYTNIPSLHKHPMTTQSTNRECNPPEKESL